MLEDDRYALGPALAIISIMPRSKADFRTIGTAEAPTSSIAKRKASSSVTCFASSFSIFSIMHMLMLYYHVPASFYIYYYIYKVDSKI
ncbi:caffeic acid 3-O-methyltransferase [Trifolium repens]|nr:caffeic acid 3-O-methyltransferase [Trifolium repens]